jgi:hypothetical protein
MTGSPCWATIGGKIGVLKVDMNDVDPEEATSWLRKRHLPHDRKVDSDSDYYMISEVPDVLWINSEKTKWEKIYKGVIIISTSANDAARINMKNKEIELLENIN